jgi:preprotein translocase subunit SecG
MSTLLTILIVVCALLLATVVLLQPAKEAGMSASESFAAIGGVQRTMEFLEKATWFLFALFVVLIMAKTAIDKPKTAEKTQQIEQE